jgi:chemotaxis protein methyltransferase CheR
MIITDYESFKTAILQMTGVNLSSYKERQMKRRIDALIAKNGFAGYESYVNAIKSNKDLFNEFINYITINVSEFYRNPIQWATLEKDVIPMLINNNNNNPIKIWSAACSTGEEPYSLVMLMSKFFPLNKIKIYATDIDDEARNKAQIGIYTPKSIENLSDDFVDKFFEKEGDNFRISDEVKRCVEFKHHNLLSDKFPEGFDLIVCRNVLIYFTEEAKDVIYENFSKSLKHNGVLFIGSTEQIISYAKFDFKILTTFFYQKL